MNDTQWDQLSPEQFWVEADDLQRGTLGHARDLFALAETADPDALRTLLVGYRLFTIYYTGDLAILVARLDDGPIRSFLGEILNDELGTGDPLAAHPRLYDDFLRSVGVSDENLDALSLPGNVELLDAIRAQLADPNEPTTVGIGLRGMGGECVCQVYLAEFHAHMMRNPFIRDNAPGMDWRFWDLHVGEHDIEHRLATRRIIDEEIVTRDARERGLLSRGYVESMETWRRFWANVVASAVGGPPAAPAGDAHAVGRSSDPGVRISQFHLAIPVRDLGEAREFYVGVLGASEGRSTENHIDFDLHGHHLVTHVAPPGGPTAMASFDSDFHGEDVPVPHFGLNLDHREWERLAERIADRGYEFLDPPHVRLAGLPGEHRTLFLADPSGNALEFKAFRDHDEAFSTIFAHGMVPTPAGLGTLVRTPAPV